MWHVKAIECRTLSLSLYLPLPVRLHHPAHLSLLSLSLPPSLSHTLPLPSSPSLPPIPLLVSMLLNDCEYNWNSDLIDYRNNRFAIIINRGMRGVYSYELLQVVADLRLRRQAQISHQQWITYLHAYVRGRFGLRCSELLLVKGA